MAFYIEGTNVYYTDGRMIQHFGTVIKTETNRIDNETVEDIEYEFNVEIQKYVEVSRSTRTDIQIPQTSEVQQLKNEIQALKEQNASIILTLITNDLV